MNGVASAQGSQQSSRTRNNCGHAWCIAWARMVTTVCVASKSPSENQNVAIQYQCGAREVGYFSFITSNHTLATGPVSKNAGNRPPAAANGLAFLRFSLHNLRYEYQTASRSPCWRSSILPCCCPTDPGSDRDRWPCIHLRRSTSLARGLSRMGVLNDGFRHELHRCDEHGPPYVRQRICKTGRVSVLSANGQMAG